MDTLRPRMANFDLMADRWLAILEGVFLLMTKNSRKDRRVIGVVSIGKILRPTQKEINNLNILR